jgi:hypothetical protein
LLLCDLPELREDALAIEDETFDVELGVVLALDEHAIREVVAFTPN